MSNNSDYATMKSINLKADIYRAAVLSEIRNGNFNYQTVGTEKSPLENLYIRSYEYSQFPDNVTKEERELLVQFIQKVNSVSKKENLN